MFYVPPTIPYVGIATSPRAPCTSENVFRSSLDGIPPPAHRSLSNFVSKRVHDVPTKASTASMVLAKQTRIQKSNPAGLNISLEGNTKSCLLLI